MGISIINNLNIPCVILPGIIPHWVIYPGQSSPGKLLGKFTKRILTLDNPRGQSNIDLSDFNQGNSTLVYFALGNPWKILGNFPVVIPIPDILTLSKITLIDYTWAYFKLGILPWIKLPRVFLLLIIPEARAILT